MLYPCKVLTSCFSNLKECLLNLGQIGLSVTLDLDRNKIFLFNWDFVSKSCKVDKGRRIFYDFEVRGCLEAIL